MTDITPIHQFLGCLTPQAWLDRAVEQLELLLVDHAHCEKKAASTALSLMYRYPERKELLHKLSRLAREELRHFEQVLELIDEREFKYTHLSASRYASSLRNLCRERDPQKLVDLLIIGAIIEARSCERFAALAPRIEQKDPALAKYYRFLLKSESRHFTDYLKLAEDYAGEDISERVSFFLEAENKLILEEDKTFRFHSGVPA